MLKKIIPAAIFGVVYTGLIGFLIVIIAPYSENHKLPYSLCSL